MVDRPLGITDVIQGVSDRDPAVRSLAGYVPWYWCRRHECAEHTLDTQECEHGLHSRHELRDDARQSDIHDWCDGGRCIRVGPFMSEREANRLRGKSEDGRVIWDKALGMEVET